MLNFATGEDDEIPLAGSIGEQASAPVIPMPPPVAQAPGPELVPPPAPAAPVPMAPPVAAPAPDILPAAVPQVAPYQPQAPAPIPVSRTVTPAESQNLASIDRNTAARMDTGQDQGDVSAVGAAARVQEADRREFLAESFLKERNRIADEATKRIVQRQEQANADYEEYKKFGIKDPQADDSFATRILKAITIGMGGYAAGINGGPNGALMIIQDANRENINRQKAQQEKLFQVAQRSGKNVEQAQAQRDDAFKQLDLKHSALLESSAAMLRSELARLGVPQAQIDANVAVQKAEQEALGLRERTLAGIRDDETALARADIMAAARRGKGSGAGGATGGGLGAAAQLATYAQEHPGDNPGLYTLAAKLYGPNSKAGQQAVNAAINQNKIPEGAQGTATKANAALNAINRIDKMGYTPSREEIQKWLTNQRQVQRAEEAGKGGGIGAFIGSGVASFAQGKGLIAQNEYDGLSPRARMYFTNVRQYMENIGREASGAAISQGEWNNFYGQYGPQSEGGLEAARQNIRDRFKLTGVAARTLEASGSVPADKPTSGAKAAPAGDGKKENPQASLARDALNDSSAPAGVKARALQIKKSMKAAGTWPYGD